MSPTSRRTIEIHQDWCSEHSAMHYLTASGECFGECLADLTRRGFIYLRHVGRCWFRYLTPAEPVEIDFPPEWLLALEDAHAGDPDF